MARHVMLHFDILSVFCFYISNFWRLQCPVWLFYIVLWFCAFPVLFRYCLNDFLMVPVAPVITHITIAYTLHLHCISIVRYLYCNCHYHYYYFYWNKGITSITTSSSTTAEATTATVITNLAWTTMALNPILCIVKPALTTWAVAWF